MKGIGSVWRNGLGYGWLERGSGSCGPLLPAMVETDTARDRKGS